MLPILNMRTIRLLIIIALSVLCIGLSPEKPKLIKTKVVNKVQIPTWYHEGLYFDGKDIWVSNGLKGKIWVVDTEKGKVKREIYPVGAFTEAITSAEKDVYIVSDWDSKKIYSARIDNDVMRAEKELTVEPAHPAGAAWNGKNLFLITWTRSLSGTKFRLLTMDGKFNILKSHDITEIQEPSQLAWDGKNLWVSSWYDNRVFKIDPDTLDVVGYFKSPVKKTTGIAWDGKHFWVTGTYSDLYKVELQN